MISTKKIKDIPSNTVFFIPDYQRGYKWTALEVSQLITDLFEFEQKTNNNLNQSYCLQPIVLKKMQASDTRLLNIVDHSVTPEFQYFELIDGQQRLTTLFLLITFLNNRFKEEFINDKFQIIYKTRSKSYKYLTKLSEQGLSEEVKNLSKDNIDFHHIYEAYNTIHNYFNQKDKRVDINLFESVLMFRSQLIWYEIDDEDNVDAYKVFSRLNSGKIQLTNADLIKALFLGNFSDTIETTVEKRNIALEWEQIETMFNDDEFWFFLNGSSNDELHRISFLLNHFASSNNDYDLSLSDPKFSFLVFNEKLKIEKIKDVWQKLKEEFRLFYNWYKDDELYHNIGFLLSDYVQYDFSELISQVKKSTDSKSFKESIIELIDEKINVASISDLYYKKDFELIRRILLWVNILHINQNSNLNYRFSFYRFSSQKYDVEHIKSLDSDITKSTQSQRHFLSSIFKAYNDKSFEECQTEEDVTEGEFEDVLKDIFHFLNKGQQPFISVLEKIKNKFHIQDPDIQLEEEHGIGNLCLLDRSTNRGYKNDIFPLKRQTIIDQDLGGQFVLPLTKSAFLKQFTNATTSPLIWSKNDMNSYLNYLKSQITQSL
ncbi:DUF262 domain-containing protein [Cellulophaga baltica]|uniref:DUF262 domain-containing protein n=1 Tax=Cellulophaga baltica TaxID=76594 RepID=UPI0021491BC3|nr:DUF262 domain-containing protein [Cellulophaga baltica]MCR1025460.1 DUF262 domain-containing protein [Cellulophaga baltica]